MRSKDRVLTALSHKEPDRVPVDLGGYLTTSINVEAWRRLQENANLAWSGDLLSHRSQLPAIPEEFLSQYAIDTRNVLPGDTNEPTSSTKDVQQQYIDHWGIIWKRSKDEPFVNRLAPFEDLKTPTVADLKAYNWPAARDLVGNMEHARAQAERLAKEGYSLVAGLPAKTISLAQRLRGFDLWLIDSMERPVFA